MAFNLFPSSKGLDPDLSEKTAFNALDDKAMKAEQTLVDKYQAFSAELLRLSLLGIGILGLALQELMDKLPSFSQKALALSILCFGASSFFAIAHRYCSSEALRFFIWGMRWRTDRPDLSEKCLEQRTKLVHLCIVAKAISAVTLALGAVLLAIAFCFPLLFPE
jgi:hypothetical protein